MKTSRASKFEKNKRLLTVQGWIIDGVQDDFMLKQMTKEWDLSFKQAKRYLKTAYESWKQDEDITIENKRAAKIAELKQVRRSLKPEFVGTPQGINAVARIEKMIIKLEAIEPAKKHEVEATVNHKILPTKYIDATGNRNRSTTTSD